MGKPLLVRFRGVDTHFSVGAIIKNHKGEILMIDRLKQPFGWACPAGHIDEGEEPEEALNREVEEETGLIVYDYHELSDLKDQANVPQEACSRGITKHLWVVYEVEIEKGTEDNLIFKDDEVKAIKWCSVDEIKTLPLEKAWEYWLKKLSII